MSSSLRLFVSFVLIASVGACGSSGKPTTDGGNDAAPEASVEVGPEASPDAAVESVPDASVDVPADAATDALTDAAPDAAADAPSDVVDAAAEVNPACSTIATDATRTVHLRITADNECDVYVNGSLTGTTTSWPSPVTMDVSLFIHPGRVNVIAVEGRNTSSQGGPDRGIIGELDDLTDGGSKVVIITDATWRSSKTVASGWQGVLFDDSAWDMATVVGAHGDAPWGALLGASDAKWLWTAPIPTSTADKPDLETGYFRKRFFFGFDGEVSATPGCPLVAPNQ
ncbi:MAG TPA: hypothetical protein VHJ20_03605 [Polyangia bacterium]|nr:hypothetical protein [Polyangia bacterium]